MNIQDLALVNRIERETGKVFDYRGGGQYFCQNEKYYCTILDGQIKIGCSKSSRPLLDAITTTKPSLAIYILKNA